MRGDLRLPPKRRRDRIASVAVIAGLWAAVAGLGFVAMSLLAVESIIAGFAAAGAYKLVAGLVGLSHDIWKA